MILLYIIGIIYFTTTLIMSIIVTIEKNWDEEGSVTFVFTPLLNTVSLCIGIFYVIPRDIIKEHKEKIMEKHKHDTRWKIMNTVIK